MRLLAVTPPAAIAAELDVGLVATWLDAGAGEHGIGVLLREPGADAAAILADARFARLRRVLADAGVPALVSLDPASPDSTREVLRRARPAIAGVQLRGDPSAEDCARWRADLPGLTIGRSVHGLAPSKPDRADVDYTCLAPIYTPNTPQRGEAKVAIGLGVLRRWTRVRGDVLALGGVTAANADACLDAGARGIAAIRLFFGPRFETAENVASVCLALARARAGADHGAPAQGRGRRGPEHSGT